jgi:hypothetical protein
MHDHNPTSKLFAVHAGGALWWIVDQLSRHGPSWELVPPILFAVAAVIGAGRNWLDGAQARRLAEAEHTAKLTLLSRFPTPQESTP